MRQCERIWDVDKPSQHRCWNIFESRRDSKRYCSRQCQTSMNSLDKRRALAGKRPMLLPMNAFEVADIQYEGDETP